MLSGWAGTFDFCTPNLYNTDRKMMSDNSLTGGAYMDLIKLETFLDIVERGSYSRACEDLGYSISGISKMMKSMEDEIGIPLINRTNKGISLTPDGEKVLPMIRELINYKDTLEEEFSLIRGVETGKIRIGCFPTVSFAWIPSLIAEFKEHHPNIAVEVVEENIIKNLEQWLNQGIIDIGILSRQDYHNYDWVGMKNDPYVALFPEGHWFEELEKVPVNDLFAENMVFFKSQDGIDQDIVHVMQYLNIDKIPQYTSNSDFTAIRLVERQGFVTMIPELIAKEAVGLFSVDYRPIDTEVKRELGFAVRDIKRISPAVRQLLRYVEKSDLSSY